MIRIRRGDFNYSEDEIEAMIEDVKYFKLNGADGIVFGCLNSDNGIHLENCRRIIAAWGRKKPVTFHRAFDETKLDELEANIDKLADLGFTRILSSGYESSAELGIVNLKRMMSHATQKNLIIMPGAGITKHNITTIIKETSCKEIHASARSELTSSIKGKLSMGGGAQDLQPLLICDPIKVGELLELSKSVEQ